MIHDCLRSSFFPRGRAPFCDAIPSDAFKQRTSGEELPQNRFEPRVGYEQSSLMKPTTESAKVGCRSVGSSSCDYAANKHSIADIATSNATQVNAVKDLVCNAVGYPSGLL